MTIFVFFRACENINHSTGTGPVKRTWGSRHLLGLVAMYLVHLCMEQNLRSLNLLPMRCASLLCRVDRMPCNASQLAASKNKTFLWEVGVICRQLAPLHFSYACVFRMKEIKTTYAAGCAFKKVVVKDCRNKEMDMVSVLWCKEPLKLITLGFFCSNSLNIDFSLKPKHLPDEYPENRP